MATTGRMVYVPSEVLKEVSEFMHERKLVRRSKAWCEMIKYARVGREAERIMRLKF